MYACGDVCAFPLGGKLTVCEHVHHARRSAAHCAKAVLQKATGPYEYAPFFYSRVFEYSAEPIVWNLFGDSTGKEVELPAKEGQVCSLFERDGAVTGGILMGSPAPEQEQFGKLKAIVEAHSQLTDELRASVL